MFKMCYSLLCKSCLHVLYTILLGLCFTSVIPENTGAIRICVQGFRPTAVFTVFMASGFLLRRDGIFSLPNLFAIKAEGWRLHKTSL